MYSLFGVDVESSLRALQAVQVPQPPTADHLLRTYLPVTEEVARLDVQPTAFVEWLHRNFGDDLGNAFGGELRARSQACLGLFDSFRTGLPEMSADRFLLHGERIRLLMFRAATLPHSLCTTGLEYVRWVDRCGFITGSDPTKFATQFLTDLSTGFFELMQLARLDRKELAASTATVLQNRGPLALAKIGIFIGAAILGYHWSTSFPLASFSDSSTRDASALS